jgi:predicted Rossmann-fold nucleotide-binding protein
VIAETDRVLVYGGAKVGLMGALADSVLAAGGMVIGVVPHALVERLLRRLEDCNVTSVPKWIDRGEA